ncbi:MAG: HEAT repeat domain-containing protein [Acidimicrobiales bacterium]
MDRNDATLSERLTELVRARFATDTASARLILASLDAPAVRERVLALRVGAARHLLDAATWRRGLGDDDGAVKREALVAIAEGGGGDDVLGAVADLLGDPDPLVVESAAFALGERHHGAGLERLIDVADHHDDARCREAAVVALGAIGDDAALATIIAALEDKPPVRRRAVVALANFEGPEVDAALARAREDHDWQVRSAVDRLDAD